MIGLTLREAEYLKLLYEESIEKSSKVTSVSMAKKLQVKPATVVDMIANLSGKGLVHHVKRRRITLTENGLKTASTIVRRHRIYEKYLESAFQIPPEEACSEAAKVDHALSARIVEAMYLKLGCPSSCPHEKPIPPMTQGTPIKEEGKE
ncbi:MAG: metal-dependent transcriptional regulator [Candidatus Bathyarchaeia archaeon]